MSIPAVALLCLALCGCQRTSIAPQNNVPHRGVFAGAHRALANGFELNQGQWDGRVKFRAGASRSLFLTDSGFVIGLSQAPSPDSAKSARPVLSQKHPSKVSKSFLGLEFIGANQHPKISGEKLLPGKSNYFIGGDPSKWKRNVPHYAVVRYSDLYPGIDLIVHEATTGATEYDLLAAPGADPARIQLGIRGAQSAKLDSSGELVLDTANGSVIGHAPTLYQDIDGARKSVAGGYILNDTYKAGFKVGAYDHSRPLMIDPTILPSYSTFLGGNNADEGVGIAVDSNGSAYVVGNASSTNFPTTQGAYQSTFSAATNDSEVFITKLSPDGTSLVYSTYLSGTGGSQVGAVANGFGNGGIAVDTNGSAYVIGTQGGGFPYTMNAVGGTTPGSDFVAKLSSDGSQLVYSASLGTKANNGIAVDSVGSAYVASVTSSNEARTVKLSADGSTLLYDIALSSPGSTSGMGSANAIAVDSIGDAFVAGQVSFINFEGDRCFNPSVWKLSATGSQAYSFSQGCDPQFSFTQAIGVGVDSNEDAYAVIFFGSPPGSTQIVKLDPNGVRLSYQEGLFPGGVFIDAIAVDPSGNTYVTGETSSNSLPTTSDAFQTQLPGQTSAFVTRIDPTGSVLLYSTYFGGSYSDVGNGIALDPQADGYLTGVTTSSDFPHTGGAYQGSLHGSSNAFVAEFQFPVVPSPTPTVTPTVAETPTPTPTSTVMRPTVTPNKTSEPLPTRTPNGTGSPTATQTPAPTSIATMQVTPTMTMTPTMTTAPTPTVTMTPTITATPTPVPVGPLAIAPAQINFGRVKVGTTSVEHLVRLVNPARNKSSIVITSLGLDSQTVSEPATGFEIDGLKSSCHVGDSIARGRSCTVFIAFAPPGQGASADNLVVTGDFTNSGHHLPLFGLGY